MMRRWRIGLAILGGLLVLGGTISILGNRAADKRRSELAAEHLLAA